jgi:heme exporter protein A
VHSKENDNLLEVTQLHVWRGDRHLLKGVGFAVASGQLLQLLWANGTGKTTLLRCLAGFVHAEAGQIRWQGADVRQDRDAFHWELAYLGHETALKGDLTALENLRLGCALRTRHGTERLRATLEQVGLGSINPALPVRSMSAGQQRRVALARLSLWEARLWLLDEPATNLDAAGQLVFSSLLSAHLAAGGAAIVATHREIVLPGASSRSWMSPKESLQ